MRKFALINKLLGKLMLMLCFTLLYTACANKEEAEKGKVNKVLYFRNIQTNVKGYLMKGFNPLQGSIVSKTDCFRFSYDANENLKEVAFLIKGRKEDSYAYGYSYRTYRRTDTSLIYSQFNKFGKKLPLSRANGAATAFAKEVVFKNGVPIQERGLDFFNEPLKGFTEKRYECDTLGRIVWESNVNEFGRALDITERDGVFYRKYEYTSNNLLASTSFYEIKSTKRSLGGIHKVKYEYNEDGNIKRNEFLNEEGKLVPEPGTGIAYRLMKYRKGSLVEQALYNIQGTLATAASGYALQKNTYDKYGNNTSSKYFDVEKKPVINAEIGAFEERSTYDDRGDLVLNEFFGIEEKLTNSENLGYAYKAIEYNDSGFVVREAYYDKDNKSITFRGLGAHAKISEYDEQGKLISSSFENDQGELFLHPACNCASISFAHDSIGNVVEEVFRGLNGEPIAEKKKGISKRVYTYSKLGFLDLMKYYDLNGKEITIQGNNVPL